MALLPTLCYLLLLTQAIHVPVNLKITPLSDHSSRLRGAMFIEAPGSESTAQLVSAANAITKEDVPTVPAGADSAAGDVTPSLSYDDLLSRVSKLENVALPKLEDVNPEDAVLANALDSKKKAEQAVADAKAQAEEMIRLAKKHVEDQIAAGNPNVAAEPAEPVTADAAAPPTTPEAVAEAATSAAPNEAPVESAAAAAEAPGAVPEPPKKRTIKVSDLVMEPELKLDPSQVRQMWVNPDAVEADTSSSKADANAAQQPTAEQLRKALYDVLPLDDQQDLRDSTLQEAKQVIQESDKDIADVNEHLGLLCDQPACAANRK